MTRLKSVPGVEQMRGQVCPGRLSQAVPGAREGTDGGTQAGDLPSWLARGQVPSLNGLRAVSIILVILAHTASRPGLPLPARVLEVARWGRAGVDMFFVISGFLITLLLLRELKDTRTICLRSFYLRRGLRILPAYAAFLLATWGFTAIGFVQLQPRDWLAAVTYSVNLLPRFSWGIGHVWSLSVEEHFYLLWPFLLVLLRPRRALLLASACVVLTPLMRFIVWRWFSDYLNGEYCTLTRVDGIAVGCCLALLASSPVFRARMRALEKNPLAASLLVLSVLLLSKVVSSHWQTYYVLCDKSMNALSFGALLWIYTHNFTGTIGRLLNCRVLVFVGVLSYSLYLWQQPFLNPHSDSWLARWPMNLCFVLLLAVTSYLLVERPFLRIKDGLHRRKVGFVPSTRERLLAG